MKQNNLNLSSATLYNSTADFILFFSLMSFLTEATKNVYFASYGISLKSLGMALGAIIFPYIGNYISMKKILSLSIISTILVIPLYLLSLNNLVSNKWILITMLLQSIFSQIFSGIRESYSKNLGGISDQRSLQVQILSSFFGAQIIGPLIGFFIALYVNSNFAIFISVILNAVSLFKILSLTEDFKFQGNHIFRPFAYLKFNSPLTHIFFVRSVLYWIPVGLFNFLLFPVIEKHYHLQGIYSAWVYIVIGIGSILATLSLKSEVLKDKFPKLNNILKKVHEKKDFQLAFVALVILGITRFVLISMPNLYLFLIIGVIAGMSNGFNAVSTQTIRRKLCSNNQHPEIIGLEVIVGRIVDWSVGTLCMLAIGSNLFNYSQGIILSGVLLFALAFIMLLPSFRVEDYLKE